MRPGTGPATPNSPPVLAPRGPTIRAWHLCTHCTSNTGMGPPCITGAHWGCPLVPLPKRKRIHTRTHARGPPPPPHHHTHTGCLTGQHLAARASNTLDTPTPLQSPSVRESSGGKSRTNHLPTANHFNALHKIPPMAPQVRSRLATHTVRPPCTESHDRPAGLPAPALAGSCPRPQRR